MKENEKWILTKEMIRLKSQSNRQIHMRQAMRTHNLYIHELEALQTFNKTVKATKPKLEITIG